MRAKYNAAVIGLGRVGLGFMLDKLREQPASHTSALAQNNRINLVAGCDIDERRRDLYHKYYPKARVFADYKDMMNALALDIVAISVSESEHLAIALDVIQSAPRLVILEKPVATNINDAEEIYNAAQKYNVNIAVNHNRRFANDYIFAKNMINNGDIGEIISVYAKLWAGSVIYSRDRMKTGNCSLIHDGTHLIDILRYLFGENFHTPHLNIIRKNENNEVKYLNLSYNADKTAIIVEISGENKYFGFEIDIIGSKGRIVIGNGYLKVYKSTNSPFYRGFKSLVRDYRVKTPKKTEYFKNMIKNSVAFLDGKEHLLSTLDDGVGVVRDLYLISSIID